jgi:hypothetical protein
MTKNEESSPNLTVGQCRDLAAAIFEDAAALPPGPEQQELLKLAEGYRILAAMKGLIAKSVN